MNFGISTHLFVNQRLSSHILDQIHGAGLAPVEIFAARQHLDYRDANHVRDVGQWFSDHGVILYSVHTPLFNDADWGRSGGMALSPAYLEKRKRIDSMDEIKRVIEIAERLPFRYLILHLGLPDEEYDLSKFDAAFTSLEHLKIFAKEAGVEVLLENIPSPLSTPERLIEFIQYTRMDLKVCFDTGHAHLSGGVESAFEVLKGRTVLAHLHDNRGEKDDHLMPFDGQIDWPKAVEAFRAVETPYPLFLELRDYGPESTSLVRVTQVIEKMQALPSSAREPA